MKFQLPDNAREAFQFLSIGAGVVLAVRIAISLIDLFAAPTGADPLVAAIAHYRNGYVLLDPHTLVVGGMAMIPRIAVAILFVVVTALITAACGTFITAILSRNAIKGAVLGARTGLILSSCWVIYALLALPPVSVHVSAQELSISMRHSFLGAISYPFGRNERVINWSEAGSLKHQPETDTTEHDKTQLVVLSSGTEWIPIARLLDGYSHGDQGLPDADHEALRLIEQLTLLRSSAAL